MPVPNAAEKWSGKINTVTIGATSADGGTRGRTVTIGGQKGIPFLGFEGEVPNPPLIAVEVMDIAPQDWPAPLADVYGDVWSDPAAWAKKAAELGADLINLKLVGTHPDNGDRTPEQAVETVKAVLAAVDLPLIVGCLGLRVGERFQSDLSDERFDRISSDTDLIAELRPTVAQFPGQLVVAFDGERHTHAASTLAKRRRWPTMLATSGSVRGRLAMPAGESITPNGASFRV